MITDRRRSARLRSASRRHRDRVRRHRRAACGAAASASGCAISRAENLDPMARLRSARPKPKRRAGCSAPRGASTCAGPMAASMEPTTQSIDVVRLIRASRPRTVALPYWKRSASRTIAPRATCSRGPRSRAGFAASRPMRATRGGPTGSATTSSTTRSRRSFGVDVSAHYETKRKGAGVPSLAVRAVRRRQRRDAADGPAVSAAHRKPRRASRRARRGRVRRGRRRARTYSAAARDEGLEPRRRTDRR